MAYIDVYNASVDADFQGKCLVAAREIARAIVAGETITNNAAVDLVAAEGSLNFAKRLLRLHNTISKEQIATLVLTNATIAANVSGATDSDILWQTKENWLIYVEIG